MANLLFTASSFTLKAIQLPQKDYNNSQLPLFMFVFPFVRVKEAKRDARRCEGGLRWKKKMRAGEMQACGRADCGEAEDGEWRTAAEECKGERSGSDGAEGASARGSGPADGRKGAGVNGAPVIPARCPHRPPHSSRVEQVLSPPHSTRGGEQQVQPTAPALPPASSPPKNTHTHSAPRASLTTKHPEWTGATAPGLR